MYRAGKTCSVINHLFGLITTNNLVRCNNRVHNSYLPTETFIINHLHVVTFVSYNYFIII